MPRLCSPPPCSAQQDSPEAEAVTHWAEQREERLPALPEESWEEG